MDYFSLWDKVLYVFEQPSDETDNKRMLGGKHKVDVKGEVFLFMSISRPRLLYIWLFMVDLID